MDKLEFLSALGVPDGVIAALKGSGGESGPGEKIVAKDAHAILGGTKSSVQAAPAAKAATPAPAAKPVKPPEIFPRPMAKDCKIAPGKMQGPKELALCATHGHIIDTASKTIVYANLDAFKKKQAGDAQKIEDDKLADEIGKGRLAVMNLVYNYSNSKFTVASSAINGWRSDWQDKLGEDEAGAGDLIEKLVGVLIVVLPIAFPEVAAIEIAAKALKSEGGEAVKATFEAGKAGHERTEKKESGSEKSEALRQVSELSRKTLKMLADQIRDLQKPDGSVDKRLKAAAASDQYIAKKLADPTKENAEYIASDVLGIKSLTDTADSVFEKMTGDMDKVMNGWIAAQKRAKEKSKIGATWSYKLHKDKARDAAKKEFLDKRHALALATGTVLDPNYGESVKGDDDPKESDEEALEKFLQAWELDYDNDHRNEDLP